MFLAGPNVEDHSARTKCLHGHFGRGQMSASDARFCCHNRRACHLGDFRQSRISCSWCVASVGTWLQLSEHPLSSRSQAEGSPPSRALLGHSKCKWDVAESRMGSWSFCSVVAHVTFPDQSLAKLYMSWKGTSQVTWPRLQTVEQHGKEFSHRVVQLISWE